MFSRLTASNVRRGLHRPGKRGVADSHRRKLKAVLKALQIPGDNLDLFIKTYSSAVDEDRHVPQEDIDHIKELVEPESEVLFTPDELETILAALASSNQADQVAASCLLRALMEDDTTAGVAGGMVASAAYDAFLDPTQTNMIVRVNLLNAIASGLINMPTVYDDQLPERFCNPQVSYDLWAFVCDRWESERPVAKAAHELLATMVNTDLLNHIFITGTFAKLLWHGICNDTLDDELRQVHAGLLNHIWKNGKKDLELVAEALHGWAEIGPASKVLDLLRGEQDFLSAAALDALARFLPAALDVAGPFVDLIQHDDFMDLFLSAVAKVNDLLLVEEVFAAVIIAGQAPFADQLVQSGKLAAFLSQERGSEMNEFLDVMYSVLLAFPESGRSGLWQHIRHLPIASHGYSHLATAPLTSDFVCFVLAYDPDAKTKLVPAFLQAIDSIADDGLDDVDPDHITQLLTQLNSLLEYDVSSDLRSQLLEHSQLWDVIRLAMLTPDLRLSCSPLRLVINNFARTFPSSIPTIVTVVYAPVLAQLQSKLADALPIISNIVKTNRTKPDSNDFPTVLMVIDLFEDVGNQLANFVDGLDQGIVTAICTEQPDAFNDMFSLFKQLLEVVLFDENKHPGCLQKLAAAVEDYFIQRSNEGHCKSTYSENVEQFASDVELDRENGVIGEYVEVIAEALEALVHYSELRQPCLELLPPLAAVLTRISVKPNLVRALMNIIQQVPDKDFDVYHEIGIMYYDRMITTASTFTTEPSFMATLLTLERLFIRESRPNCMHWASTTSGLTVNARGDIASNATTAPQCARGSFGVSGGGKYGFSVRFTEDGLGAVGFTTREGSLVGQQCDFFRERLDNVDIVAMDLSGVFAWHSGKCQYNVFSGFPGTIVTCILDLDNEQFLVRIGKHAPFRILFSGLDRNAVWFPYICQPRLSCSESMFYDDARLNDTGDYIPIGLARKEHLVAHPSSRLVASPEEVASVPTLANTFTPLSDPLDPPVDANVTIQYYYELEATPATPIVAVGFRQIHLYSLWIASRGFEAVVQFATGDMVEESIEWREFVPALVQWYMKRQVTADEELPDRFAAHFSCSEEEESSQGEQGWRKWSLSVEPACVDGAPNVPDDGNLLFVCGIVSKAEHLLDRDPSLDMFPLAPYCSERLLFGVAAVTDREESIEDANCFMIVTKGTDHVYEGDEFSKLVLAHESELHALPVSIGMQGVKMTMHADVTVEGANQLRGPLVKQSESPESVLHLAMANWGVPPPGYGGDEDDGWADEDELDVD